MCTTLLLACADCSSLFRSMHTCPTYGKPDSETDEQLEWRHSLLIEGSPLPRKKNQRSKSFARRRIFVNTFPGTILVDDRRQNRSVFAARHFFVSFIFIAIPSTRRINVRVNDFDIWIPFRTLFQRPTRKSRRDFYHLIAGQWYL